MRSILKSTAMALALSLNAATVLAVPTLSVQAAVPTDASLAKLIEVTKVIEQLDETFSIEQMNDMFNGDSTESIAQETLAPLADEAIQSNKVDDEGLEYFNQLFVESYKKAYIKAAKKHYNQQEVDALIDFYSSDIGRGIASKQSVFAKDYIAGFEANIIRSVTQNNTFDKDIDTDKNTGIDRDIENSISKK